MLDPDARRLCELLAEYTRDLDDQTVDARLYFERRKEALLALREVALLHASQRVLGPADKIELALRVTEFDLALRAVGAIA